jgi:hypothetical protein
MKKEMNNQNFMLSHNTNMSIIYLFLLLGSAYYIYKKIRECSTYKSKLNVVNVHSKQADRFSQRIIKLIGFILKRVLYLLFSIKSVGIIDNIIKRNESADVDTEHDLNEQIDYYNKDSTHATKLRKRKDERRRKKVFLKGILMIVKYIHYIIALSFKMYFIKLTFSRIMSFYTLYSEETILYKDDDEILDDCFQYPLKNRKACVDAELRHMKWPIVKSLERFFDSIYLCIEAPCSEILSSFFSGMFTKLAFLILMCMFVIYTIPYILALYNEIQRNKNTKDVPHKPVLESVSYEKKEF